MMLLSHDYLNQEVKGQDILLIIPVPPVTSIFDIIKSGFNY